MTHVTFARDSLALFCAVQGCATLAIDLGRAHASNPQWSGHARFHVIWQTANTVLLAMMEVALLFSPGPLADLRFYLSATLAAVPILGFLIACGVKSRFRGTLSDPYGGIQPMRLKILNKQCFVDLNLAVVIVGMFALVTLIELYRH